MGMKIKQCFVCRLKQIKHFPLDIGRSQNAWAGLWSRLGGWMGLELKEGK